MEDATCPAMPASGRMRRNANDGGENKYYILLISKAQGLTVWLSARGSTPEAAKIGGWGGVVYLSVGEGVSGGGGKKKNPVGIFFLVRGFFSPALDRSIVSHSLPLLVLHSLCRGCKARVSGPFYRVITPPTAPPESLFVCSLLCCGWRARDPWSIDPTCTPINGK